MSKNQKKEGAGNKHGGGHGSGMGMQTQKAKDFKGTVKRLAGYLKPQKIQLIAVFITAILSTVFTILSPKILGKATTELFQGMVGKIKGIPGAGIDFGYILQIIIILVGLYLFGALFMYVQQYIMAGVAQKMVYALRKEVNAKLSRLPLRFFDSRSHGEVLSRVVNDMENISRTLQQSLAQLVTSIVTFIGVIVMMLTISPLLALVVFLTLPPSFLVTAKIASRSQRHFKGQRKALGELNGHVEEMYGGHEIVKVFGREDESVKTFQGLNEKLYDSGWRAMFVSGIIMPLMRFINNIGYVFIAVIGGVLVTRGAIQVGDIQAFIQYARQFSQPITQMANMANIIQSTIASAERVFEVLDEEEEEPETEEKGIIESPRGNVQFDNVKFGYEKDHTLIEDMDIDVKQGQTIAIVGPTGAGKTTLVNLMMRFYEIDGGRISVDGVDIRDLKRGHLRSLFGMVLQDTWLFNGTIRENIAYGRKDVSEEAIVQAAETADADHFIRTLPDGYDTVLNEEASNISQGQKQLLTIARAILADPAILILDEATSSVDTRTEVHIQNAMNKLMKGRTNFVIAHRLSTIRGADTILVMNKGNVIEKGNHDELLAKDGFYADLYNSQFADNQIVS